MTAGNFLRFQENGHEIWITIPPKVENHSGTETTPAAEEGSNENHTNEAKVISLDDLYPADRNRRENHKEDFASSKLPFVWKLYEMLEDVKSSGQEHIVSWVGEGTAFKAHKLEEFVDNVIPKYFKLSKFKSFQRQLYFYGFTRIQSGPEAGAYHHPKFIRGKKTLCLSMSPKTNRRRRRSSSSSTVSNGSTTVSSNHSTASDDCSMTAMNVESSTTDKLIAEEDSSTGEDGNNQTCCENPPNGESNQEYQNQDSKERDSQKVNVSYQQKWLSYEMNHLYIIDENKNSSDGYLHPSPILVRKKNEATTAQVIPLDAEIQSGEGDKKDKGGCSSTVECRDDIEYVYGMPFHCLPGF